MTQAEAPEIDGDHAKFVRMLFERYRRSLFGYLNGLLEHHVDAEDVLQETYARLLSAHHLDRDVGRARSYAFRIATNLAYDTFKRRKRSVAGDAVSDEDIAGAESSPEMIVNFEQSLDIVADTLLELPSRCRQVFLLRVSEGLSYESIAEKLEVSKRTVEREMKRALDACQEQLKRSQT